MQSLINQYNDNTIWEVLVTYDFSNKNHKDFAPLFTHVKHKLTNLDINDGIYNFYEWKKGGDCVIDKSYVKKQQIGLLPQKWDILRIRITGDRIGAGWISYLDKGNIEEGVRKILFAAA